MPKLPMVKPQTHKAFKGRKYQSHPLYLDSDLPVQEVKMYFMIRISAAVLARRLTSLTAYCSLKSEVAKGISSFR